MLKPEKVRLQLRPFINKTISKDRRKYGKISDKSVKEQTWQVLLFGLI
jgi:hypothetical protein